MNRSANSTRSWIQESYMRYVVALIRILLSLIGTFGQGRPSQAWCSHGSVVGVTSLRGGCGDFRVQGHKFFRSRSLNLTAIFKFNREIAPQQNSYTISLERIPLGFMPTRVVWWHTNFSFVEARIGAVCRRPDAEIQRFIFSTEAEWP